MAVALPLLPLTEPLLSHMQKGRGLIHLLHFVARFKNTFSGEQRRGIICFASHICVFSFLKSDPQLVSLRSSAAVLFFIFKT